MNHDDKASDDITDILGNVMSDDDADSDDDGAVDEGNGMTTVMNRH